jgi:hypothetical protein
MADYNYKIDLDEPVEMGSKFKPRSRGIGVQPEKEEPESDSWSDMFYGLLQGYFGDEDEAKKALTTEPEKPSYDMDDALQTLKSVNLPSRISEPVIEGVPEKPEMGSREPYELEVDTIGNEALDRNATRLVDVTDTEEGKLTNEEPLYKMAEEIDPGTVDTEPLDADGGASTGGKGLMSPTTEETDEDTTEVSTYSSTTNAVYTDFYDNNEEGDVAHVGQDSQNLTLPAGIVADGGVTYDGKEVKAGKNTVKASAFDASKVDMSKAYKKVGDKTYKREDYDSDEAWSKAIIEGFKDVVKDKAGDSWDNLTDTTKQAVTKLAWNNGEGWAKYNTSQALYKELAKDTKDKTIIADGILNYSTVAGGGASIGVAKARANAWNKMSDAHGFAKINKITADNTGAKTKFNYYDAQGSLIHTETTSRASSKYSSTATEVEKDAQGAW